MLFQFAVKVARDRGSPGGRALVGAAGPFVSLALGLLFWLAYRRARGGRAGWEDFGVLAVAAVAVRVMARGIAFGP